MMAFDGGYFRRGCRGPCYCTGACMRRDAFTPTLTPTWDEWLREEWWPAYLAKRKREWDSQIYGGQDTNPEADK